MTNDDWPDLTGSHNRKPPDRGGGGAGGGAGTEVLHQGGAQSEATGTRPKTNDGMRGAAPATSSPSEETPSGVSNDSNQDSARLSQKVIDFRDPRNLPALGQAINYARVAAGPRRSEAAGTDMPETYRLTLELVSYDNSRNYTMNHDELAKLLFERIRLPGGECILGYDSNEQQYIHLDIDARVKAETLNLADGFVIRQGLRMKPIRPVENDTLVKLFWTPMHMDNAEIKAVLEMFGTVTGEIEYTKFKIRKDAPAATKELEKIRKCSDREVKMKLNMAIPPNIKVGTKKIRVWHHKMKKQCFWCLQLEDVCPYDADGKACKEAGTCEKEDWENFWNEMCRDLRENPMTGIAEQSQFERSVAKHMVASNFPKDVTAMDVVEMFGLGGIMIDPEGCEILVLNESARVTFGIDHLTAEEKDWIMININRMKCKDRRIFIQPLVELTPKKTVDPAEMERKREEERKKLEEEAKRKAEEEARKNFEMSKSHLEKMKGRQLSNKEKKKLRRSLAGPVILDDEDEDTLDNRRRTAEAAVPILPHLAVRTVPDTPDLNEGNEGWSYVTSPGRRKNRKSKESQEMKDRLPGDTLYGTLEEQLAEAERLQRQLQGYVTPNQGRLQGFVTPSLSPKSQRPPRVRNVFQTLAEIREEGVDGGDEEAPQGGDGANRQDTLSTTPFSGVSTPLHEISEPRELGELKQLSSDSDSESDDGTQKLSPCYTCAEDEDEHEEVSEVEVSDEDDDGTESLKDLSPGSVESLVGEFEKKIREEGKKSNNNKRSRSDSNTPDKSNASPALTKREKKKAKVKARAEAAKKVQDVNCKTRDNFLKSPKSSTQ